MALEDVDVVLPFQEGDPEIDAAIRALAPRQRLIVFLRCFADLSYPEIAQVAGVTEGTVAATLSQAHAALRAALTEPKVR
jgi:RNA polymerase sigma factor (sigma-70 family)